MSQDNELKWILTNQYRIGVLPIKLKETDTEVLSLIFDSLNSSFIKMFYFDESVVEALLSTMQIWLDKRKLKHIVWDGPDLTL